MSIVGDPNVKLLPALVLPCGDCAHAVVCSIRPRIEDPDRWSFPAFAYEIEPAIHAQPSIELTCDHFLEIAVPSPVVEAPPPAKPKRKAAPVISEANQLAINAQRRIGFPSDKLVDPPPVEATATGEESFDDRRKRLAREAAERTWRTSHPEDANGSGSPATGGGPGLGRQQQRILEATLRHDGDRKVAAAELGLSLGNVEAQLEYIGRKGLLPIELIAKLPARFAKYQGA